MKIAVAGTGYVGLVTAVCFAEIGNYVTCVDIDEKKIEIMNKGISPIHEANLTELMVKNKKRLKYTTDYKSAYQDKDVIFIGVGTPERKDGSANLDYVYNVVDQIISSINKNIVLVIKSTVPIGTNDDVEKYILSKKIKYKVDIVSNPEFLAQGTAVKDTLYASRIVVGTETENAKKTMRKLYKPLTKKPYNVPYIEVKRRSAEMVKYASNDFLALKICYINEIANLCEILDADINEVTKGMSYDKRIGDKFLNSGIGYGGSCFPKDTKALYMLAKENDYDLKLVKQAILINENQKLKLFNKLKEDFKSLKNKKIAVLGVTFKPNTDDIREAPSIINVKKLLDENVIVNVYDPVGLDNFRKIFKDKINYYTNINKAIEGADAVFILTEWDEVKKYNVNNYAKLMKKANIYDGRNCYDSKIMKDKKISYYSIGRKRMSKNV